LEVVDLIDVGHQQYCDAGPIERISSEGFAACGRRADGREAADEG
jgi:hypothetical protein